MQLRLKLSSLGYAAVAVWPQYQVTAKKMKEPKEPIVKITTTTVKTAIGAAGIAAVSVVAAATASAAPPNIQGFGTSEPLIDGPLVTNYTVSNLQPSNVAIPGYTPKGTLYRPVTASTRRRSRRAASRPARSTSTRPAHRRMASSTTTEIKTF